MNESQLGFLIGETIQEAEKVIRQCGLEPRVFHKNDIRTMACIPSNMVEINHDDNNLVVSAYTQASIDAKYQ